MQIAIVDDELEWQIKVKEYLKKYWSSKSLNIDMFIDGAEFDYGKEYDVVFLDVEMKNRDGFETAKLYRKTHENAIIIFLTSHQELCNRGYMVNAFRYIDKGNLEEELDEALTAFEDIHKRYHIITFHIPNMGDVTCRIKDIFYIETEKRNVIIHTNREDIYSNKKIEELEKELREFGFFRCHKSYIINLDKIDYFDKMNVYFVDGRKAMVSSRKFHELKLRHLQQRIKMANL